MAKTRPGIDRIRKQELQAAKSGAVKAQSAHMRQCGRCQNAGNDVYARCTVWWIFARQIHQANRQLRIYRQSEAASMVMLPGMDEL